jgi:pimeloyl-ACP methyl ester carboxylesterase
MSAPDSGAPEEMPMAKTRKDPIRPECGPHVPAAALLPACWLVACATLWMCAPAQAQTNLSGSLSTGTDYSAGTLTNCNTPVSQANCSATTLNSGANVTLMAGSQIVLGPGFTAQAANSSTSLVAQIGTPPPNFTLSLTPGTAAVLAGSTPVTYTVTVGALYGFTGAVTFAVSGLPSGATASFSPSSVSGSGSTTLSISAPVGTAGNYGFTVSATSGSLAHTGAALLSVQDFTWTVSPTNQSVTASLTVPGYGLYTASATALNGFNSTVWPSVQPCAGWPAIILEGSPNAFVGTGSTPFTLGPIYPQAGFDTPNTWCVTVSASGHSATVYLTATPNPALTMGILGGQAISPPGSGTYTVIVSSTGGFSGTVSLGNVTGLPAGASASFNPSSLGLSPMLLQGQSMLTVTVPAGTPVGSYSFTATAVGGGLSQSANGSLAVSGPGQVVQTSPSGLVLLVDGAACTTPCSYPWTAGTTHTLSIATTIAGATGAQYIFSNWSDGNTSPSRTITVGSTPTAYTANFTTQYYLTTSVAPAGAGTITPGSAWYNSGTTFTVSATATPGSGYQFSNFSGSLTGTSSSGYFSVAGTGTITANFGAPVSTPLPDLTDMAMLSMFVERHQWLLSQPGYSTSGLYNISSGDLATVNSVVASAQAQLAQLASQASSYISQGNAWVSARNAILQGLRTQLQSGISPSSYQALASYMSSTILPSLTVQPLTANSGLTASSACPAGDTCWYASTLISFYSGGLGGRIDGWVEGPDAPKFCVGESGFKGLFNGANLGAPASNNACGASVDHSYVGFTTEDPQSGTYEVEAFLSVSGDGISMPSFPGATSISQGSGDFEFILSSGYIMLSTPVGLSLSVSQPAGVPNDPSGQNAVLTSCSGSIIVQANLTPQLPAGNTAPPITWNVGSPGADNMHRVVPCPTGSATTVTAAIGANLSAALAVSVQTLVTISGTVTTASGTGVSGITVDPQMTIQTNSSGYYSVTVPVGTSYVVQPNDPWGTYWFAPPFTSFDDITSNQTANFTANPVTYVYLIHGINQTSAAMRDLYNNLTSPSNGVNTLQYHVDAGYNFGCATTCGSACSVSSGSTLINLGAQWLGYYIQQQNPPGNIILVGYSMGGLIARDFVANNYYGVITPQHPVTAVITLGTPNLGYPYSSLDHLVAGACSQLLLDMSGSWEEGASNWFELSSPYLNNLAQQWASNNYTGYWMAAAGEQCSNTPRNVSAPGEPPVGCMPESVTSDGVVCRDSALYGIESVGVVDNLGPTPYVPWYDTAHIYVHTDNWAGWGTAAILCGNSGNPSVNPPLFNPPPTDTLFPQIQAAISAH